MSAAEVFCEKIKMAFGNLKRIKNTYEQNNSGLCNVIWNNYKHKLKFLKRCRGYDTWLSRKRPKFDSKRRYSNLIFASF